MGSEEIDLKSCVEDELYESLKARLLADGKDTAHHINTGTGVPLELTNKVLLQLYFLREEGGKTHKWLEEWFACLYPDVFYPQHKISYVVKQTFKRAKGTLTHDELNEFLSSKVQLEKVSDALSSLSLTRKELLAPETWHRNESLESQAITNQVVVDLEHFKSSQRLVATFTQKWMLRLLSKEINTKNLGVMKARVAKVLGKKYKLCQNKLRNPKGFEDYMKQTFESSAPEREKTSVGRPVKTELPCKCSETRWKREARLKEDCSRLKSEVLLYKELYEEEVRLNKEMNKDFERKVSARLKEDCSRLKTEALLYKELYEEEKRLKKEMITDFERKVSTLQEENTSLSTCILKLKNAKRKSDLEERSEPKVPKTTVKSDPEEESDPKVTKITVKIEEC